MANKILAIDFDGVIHDNKNPLPGRRMGLPIKGAKFTLEYFKDRGFKIIIHSVWGNKGSVIEAWMQYHGLPFDKITNIKPDADYYIDDKAVTFTTWDNVRKTCQ